MKYLDAFLEAPELTQAISASKGPGTDKTAKSPITPLLSVLSVPEGKDSQNSGASERQEHARLAWAAASARLARLPWPPGGFETLRRLQPDAAGRIDAAEELATEATVAFVASGADGVLDAALARWERAQVDASAYLARACADCGREVTVALVFPQGRLCRRCLSPGRVT